MSQNTMRFPSGNFTGQDYDIANYGTSAANPKISAFMSADYFYYPSLDYIAKSNY